MGVKRRRKCPADDDGARNSERAKIYSDKPAGIVERNATIALVVISVLASLVAHMLAGWWDVSNHLPHTYSWVVDPIPPSSPPPPSPMPSRGSNMPYPPMVTDEMKYASRGMLKQFKAALAKSGRPGVNQLDPRGMPAAFYALEGRQTQF